MTLQKYISNPTGKGSAYVANRAAIKGGLNMTFIKLLRNYRKQFYAMPFVYGNGDLLFYVKVPSEKYDINKISYDVCFLFKYEKEVERKNRQIFMYSNSPSFIFTYCYTYNVHGFLIDKLKSKLPNLALTKAPDIRNPIQSLGYEKSTYIAARYLLDGNCLTDAYINRYGKTMTPQLESSTFSKIADPELLVAIYQHAEYKARKNHRTVLTANERSKRDKQASDYVQQQKANKPKEGFIVHKSPRSIITARKAQKAFNNAKTPMKPIKPRKV